MSYFKDLLHLRRLWKYDKFVLKLLHQMKFLIPLFFCFIALSKTFAQDIIRMEKSGGIYLIPCKVNGLALEFVFDTGASDVSISSTEALFMLKNGYLKVSDLKGKVYYSIANGEIEEGTKINIQKIEVGKLTLYNVEASIVHSAAAPLLFGQSAMERFGKFTMDYSNSNLIIGEANNSQVIQKPVIEKPVTNKPNTLKRFATFNKLDHRLFTGLTSNNYCRNFGESNVIPFSLVYDSRFNSRKNAIRINYSFFINKNEFSYPTLKNYFNCFQLDLKFILKPNNHSGLYVSPSIGLIDLVRYSEYNTYSQRRSENSFSFGPRVGYDFKLNDKLCLSTDIALLKLINSSYFNGLVEFNLLFGYRYFK
jgi:clan AA aspartic protease (TIGR02281 family)